MEPVIYMNHNGVVITPYHKGQAYQLEKYTSSYDEVYHKHIEVSGFKVDNFCGSSAFITYKQPINILDANFHDYRVIKTRANKSLKMKSPYALNPGITLTPVQLDLATRLISTLHAEREWFIHLQTGIGKTLLTIHLASLLNTKTYITCFLTDVLTQWMSTLDTMTDMNTTRVLYIKSSKTLNDLMTGKIDHNKYDIYISTPGLLTEFGSSTDYRNINEVLSKLGIGLLVYDEAHRNMSNITKINALTDIKYTIYLSADYGQGDSFKEMQFFNIVKGALVLEPKEQDAYALKNTKLMVVDYNSKPNSIEKDSIFNRYGFSASQYMEYQFRREIILDVVTFILKLITKKENNFRTLILLTQIDHVDTLAKSIASEFPNKSVGRYHSQVEPDEKHMALTSAEIIVSTYKSFGTGLDAKDIKYVIGLNQSNKIEDNQAAGRARPPKDGSSAFYIMIVDRGFSYCSTKLKKRLAYLKDAKSKENPFIYHYYTDMDLK